MESILKIENENFEKISNFFKSKENSIFDREVLKITNLLIYQDENILENRHHLKNIKNLPILFDDENALIFQNCIDHLKKLFKIKKIWFMVYGPKTHLSFHIDVELNRHVVSFNDHENFYNYNCDKSIQKDEFDEYTKKLESCVENPDEFNHYFLNQHFKNTIRVFKKNHVYQFNDLAHTFFNASKDKNRFNLVFEVF